MADTTQASFVDVYRKPERKSLWVCIVGAGVVKDEVA